MLQRAASNAYTWWWASHVRTKQSKWLEQSLQDMEEKVDETLRIIENDGDTFAQRVEMYYRKRPELIDFVKEALRAYRTLAERYDQLSKELQCANRTISSVYPDRIQYPMDEHDEEEIGPETSSSSPHDPNNSISHKLSIPDAPKTPKKEFRSPSMLLSKKGPLKRLNSSARFVTTPTSGLTKAEALAEIDKLQKEILALQTEKEFVRSLYERAYEKYWEIEDQITGMQKSVCNLQDEFRVGTVIEDNEARTLMAATALKSCQETLAKLQEMQAQSCEEAKIEYQRVMEAHEKFESLRDEFISKHTSHKECGDWDNYEFLRAEHRRMDEEIASLEQETHDVGLLREKIREKLEDSNSTLTVTEMAERIDELVNKVVALETSISSQNGLVKRLRSETDELQTNIQSLEEDKEKLIEGSDNMNKRLKELEEELHEVKNLNRSVKYQANSIQTHFTETGCNIEHLSGRLQNVKLDEEPETSVLDKKKSEESKEHADYDLVNEENNSNLRENVNFRPARIQKLKQQDKNYREDLSETVSSGDTESKYLVEGEEENQPNWRQMFINGLDDREKILLEEYTSVLRNYKDVRAKLNDVEKKNRDSVFELALQVRELKNSLATKDKEIHLLHQKLVYPESNPDEIPLTPFTEYRYTPQEGLFHSAAQSSNLQDSETSSQILDEKAVSRSSTSFSERSAEITGRIGASPANSHFSTRERRQGLSTLEKKFRSDIDDLLEENLEFWLRFSTSVHQIQKFPNTVQDLQAELSKITYNNRNSEANSNSRHQNLQSAIRPIFRHMREIRTELSLWLEHNAVLQDELQGRYSSLGQIQEKISRAFNANSEEKREDLSRYQAAKFQGELINMKQEHNKIASELQAGLSLVRGLKDEVDKTLAELDEAYGVHNQPEIVQRSTSRARLPLTSFLFGKRSKMHSRQASLFSCVNPVLQRQFSDLSGANNLPIEREEE